MRPWIILVVIGVWIGTALVILILTQIHPSTLASASLVVRQFSFKTDAKDILSATNEQQLVISGLSSLEIRSNQGLSVTANNRRSTKVNYLQVSGRSRASCSFDNVVSTGLKLSEPSLITLVWPERKNSFGVISHGSVAGGLTSQPRSGFSCRNVEIAGSPVDSLDVEFSPSGGDSLDFITITDARLDYRDIETSLPGDSQIPIKDTIRVSYIESAADSTEEKTVLLPPPAGEKNRIKFDSIGREVILDNGDLLVIEPKSDFYLRQFKADGGIVLSLKGVVSDIKVGAGVKDLRSEMPSVFDHLDAKSRALALIPSIVALVFGVLEKAKVLPAK